MNTDFRGINLVQEFAKADKCELFDKVWPRAGTTVLQLHLQLLLAKSKMAANGNPLSNSC